MPAETGNDRSKILIVEDSPTQAELLRHLVEGHGCGAIVAVNGKEALAVLRRERPDIIISDIVMPEMDGFALCKAVKADQELREIPFVLLTSLSSPYDVVQALQCGADNFIRKPYDEKYLLSRIDRLLANRDLRETGRIETNLKIRFAGGEYLITSERQQILDLLISIYEEAIHLNQDLEARQRDLARSYQSLNGLYFIAEGLSKCTSVPEVGERALERSLRLPGVRAGWIFLREGESGFRLGPTFGLPQALKRPGAMEGDCLCRRNLLSGEMANAVNILECERLQKADGDTRDLRYHASIPLHVDGRTLGMMNLAGTDNGLFNEEDLKLLHGVGNQVAVALERAELYESLEKKVRERTAALTLEIAERERAQEQVQRNLERIRALHEIDTAIASTLDLQGTLKILLDKIEMLLPDSASVVRLVDRETGKLERAACRNVDEVAYSNLRRKTSLGFTSKSIRDRAAVFIPNAQTDSRVKHPEFFREQGLVSYLLVPLFAKNETVGVLTFFSKGGREFTADEVEFAQTLAGQGAVAIYNAQLYQEMVKTNRVKDDFLSVMSHELRTPLNVMMGYAAMIKDRMLGETNPQQDKALQKIIDQANDQLEMINNVLYATVLGVKKPGVDSRELSVAAFLEELKSVYDIRLHAEGPVVRWEYANDLPVIQTDAAKLRIVVQNLIGNAMKFASKGTVTVSVRAIESMEQGERFVEFKVADTGVGIPKEHLPFIFDKFRQADSSQTRSYGGVGIGLYIVKEFTELLGGVVGVESESGKGSTFTVTIPERLP